MTEHSVAPNLGEQVNDNPTSGGFFSEFLESYRPPDKPFPVILPRGELFLFNAIPDEAAWDKLKKDAGDMAKRLLNGVPVNLARAAGKNPTRNALAFVCCKTMHGWYAAHDVDDSGEPVGIGEMRPAWEFIQWLEFARDVPTVFDAVRSKVDEGQVNHKNLNELREVNHEKKE